MSEPIEDRPYRWTIEPHPYDGSYDTFVTDDDNAARDALLALWDDAAYHPKFSCEFDAGVVSTSSTTEGAQTLATELEAIDLSQHQETK